MLKVKCIQTKRVNTKSSTSSVVVEVLIGLPASCPVFVRLDPILYLKCEGDAARLCHTRGWNETSELMPPGAVFSCLYRHAYRTEEQGRRVRRTSTVPAGRLTVSRTSSRHQLAG